jgi:iron complex outermembrane receptor protein
MGLLLMSPDAALSSTAVDPAAANAPLETIVVEAAPIPGDVIDIDRIAGNVQVLHDGDLAREGAASLAGALNSTLSSVTLNEALDDPYQPDIAYRGFTASPVLGTPQGLAVYQNGVRINEAFGDTVNWDLFPDVAISRVELNSASPVYGLNALGGALSLTMKNAFNWQGAQAALSAGSYGQRAVESQYGVTSGPIGFYAAGKALDWDGWRVLSADRIRQLYTSFGVHTASTTFDLSYARAENTLNGQGSAPVQELAVNHSLVFTGPQANANTLNFLTLNGTQRVGADWSLQEVAYYRQYAQDVSNGNTTSYIACTTAPGILCQPDGITPLTGASGQALPDISAGGTVPIGENDRESIAAWGRGATVQASDRGKIAGRDNQLTLGASVNYAATRFHTVAQLGVINPQLLVLPSNLLVDTPENSAGALANGDAVPVSVDSVNRNLGTYFTDTFSMTPALALTVSGRYNVAHIDLYDQVGTRLDGHNRFAHFNPAAGATYRLAPVVTLYGSLSQNARTPTASEIECSSPAAPCLLPTNLAGDPPNLRQVIARTAELGLRGRMRDLAAAGPELSWNLGLFRTSLHDDIYGVATSAKQGFYQNIGDTRRQGAEAGITVHDGHWSAFANVSLVQATFQSSLRVPSPSNPAQDAQGDLTVRPGDRLPGIPAQRLKVGAEYRPIPAWTLGAALTAVSSFHYVGDESNQLAPVPGHHVLGLHASYRPAPAVEIFAQVNNLLNARYATWGILSDPTGVGAPGIPAHGVTNGPGVDNRFQSPAAPFEIFGGVRVTF